MKKLLTIVLLFVCNAAIAKAPDELPVRFDFRTLAIAQVVQLIYSDALSGSYVIDPEILKDERAVSFRYNGERAGLKGFIASFFDSLGLTVTRRGTVDFISRKVQAVAVLPDDEVLVYKPRFRDGSYLVEILGPLFKGSFTAKRGIHAAPGDPGAQRVAPADSAAAMIDRKSDTLVFSGPPGEVVRLRRLLAQVDESPWRRYCSWSPVRSADY